MRKATIVIGALYIIGTVIFTGCNAPAAKNTPAEAPAAQSPAATPTGKIAYVNIDTLEANYEFLKAKREQFKTRQEQMEGELERSYQQMHV